jgi:hypothetical protein
MNAGLIVLGGAASAFGLVASLTGSLPAAAYAVVFSGVSALLAAHGRAAASSASQGVDA